MVKAAGAAVKPDSLTVEFDDQGLLADAGVILTSTLVDRLGLERLVDETVDLGERAAARPPGDGAVDARHLSALVHVRARVPARPGAGRDTAAGVVCGRRPRG